MYADGTEFQFFFYEIRMNKTHTHTHKHFAFSFADTNSPHSKEKVLNWIKENTKYDCEAIHIYVKL